VYRLLFHPLSKYPGPFLAKITDVHQLYHAWKGDRHLEFWRMHEKYGMDTSPPSCGNVAHQTGKIVRFGPNSVSFNSNVALKDIYGFKSNVRKSEFYDAFVHPTPNTHNTRDKAVHGRKRRVLSQAFSEVAIKQMEKYVVANVRTFCQQIGTGASDERKGWTTPKNMADWCNYLAMDILGDLSFGKAFHMLERPDNRYALDLVSMATTRHLIVSVPMPYEIILVPVDDLIFTPFSVGQCHSSANCTWTRSFSTRSPPAEPSTWPIARHNWRSVPS
jgi:hypothetical protein